MVGNASFCPLTLFNESFCSTSNGYNNYWLDIYVYSLRTRNFYWKMYDTPYLTKVRGRY